MASVDSQRRKFLQYTTLCGATVPLTGGLLLPAAAASEATPGTIFRFPDDLSGLTAEQQRHLPRITLPPVVEDGSQAPIEVVMDHPMEEDDYIKSIQILNFSDPIVIKGKFYFTPQNGEAYIATQIRLNGGESTVWVVAECSKHGRYAASKTVKVAAGGC